MDENTMNNNVIEEVAEIPAQEETIGNIKIAVDVIATIAGIATMEIQGVASMCTSFAGGIAEILGTKKSPTRGVKVEMTEAGTTIDVYIVVDYGVRIPELAWEVQENVKNSVESMLTASASRKKRKRKRKNRTLRIRKRRRKLSSRKRRSRKFRKMRKLRYNEKRDGGAVPLFAHGIICENNLPF